MCSKNYLCDMSCKYFFTTCDLFLTLYSYITEVLHLFVISGFYTILWKDFSNSRM